MANIKKQLKELRGEDKLTDYVIRYTLKNYTTEDDIKGFIEDVLQYGCQSGIVGDLTYYSDTVKFYKKYQLEINDLLKELIGCAGLNIQDLFGSNFDQEDPLILDYSNRNLLAWFGFEETLRSIESRIF